MPSQEKPCRHCREQIAAGATVCKHCGRYQSRFKYWVQFVATNIALIAAVVAVVAWLAQNWSQIRAVFNPRNDVRMVSCDSTKSVTFANSGDGDVFVSHVLFEAADPVTHSLTAIPEAVDETIAPGKILTHTFSAKYGSDVFIYIKNVPASEWAHFRETAIANSQCFRAVYFLKSDPRLTELKTMTVSLNTFPAHGHFSYYSTIDGMNHEISVDVESFFQLAKKPECSQFINEYMKFVTPSKPQPQSQTQTVSPQNNNNSRKENGGE